MNVNSESSSFKSGMGLNSDFWENCLELGYIGFPLYQQVLESKHSDLFIEDNALIPLIKIFKDLSEDIYGSFNLLKFFERIEKSSSENLFLKNLPFKHISVNVDVNPSLGVLPMDIDDILRMKNPHVIIARRSPAILHEWLTFSMVSTDYITLNKLKDFFLITKPLPELKFLQLNLDTFIKYANTDKHTGSIENALFPIFDNEEIDVICMQSPSHLNVLDIASKQLKYHNFMFHSAVKNGERSPRFMIISKRSLKTPEIIRYKLKNNKKKDISLELNSCRICAGNEESSIRVSYIDFTTDEYCLADITSNFKEINFWLNEYWSDEIDTPHVLITSLNKIEETNIYEMEMAERNIIDIYSKRTQNSYCLSAARYEHDSEELYEGIYDVKTYNSLLNNNFDYFLTSNINNKKINCEIALKYLSLSDVFNEKYALLSSFTFN